MTICRKPNSRRSEASALMTTLVVAAVLGFLLVSYLWLVRSQLASIVRSQSWNAAVPMMEAGVEEAIVHLNQNGTTNLHSNGWTLEGSRYRLERSLNDCHYVVYIDPNGNQPIIECQGFVPLSYYCTQSGTVVAVLGDVQMNAEQYVNRKVRVTTRVDAALGKAMQAKGKIVMSGDGVLIDSFDSTDPNYSTNGQYDPTKRKHNGDVATNGTFEKAVDASGQIKVFGKVSTGPQGTLGISGQIAIGSKAWVDSGKEGVETGYLRNDMNVSFSDVSMPSNPGLYPMGGTVNGVTYTHILGPGTWELSKLDLGGSSKVLVTGDAVLKVKGDFVISGDAYIYIEPGASLKTYVQGNASISGSGVINGAGNAASFSYYGLPTNTDISLSGDSTWIGTIYAPGAKLSMSGGSSTSVDFIGSTVTSEVNLSGKYKIHYDESLSNGTPRGYVITSWNEI